MAYSSNYNPAKDSGSSANFTSDLNPESKYDLDLRNLDPAERRTARIADTEGRANQNRVAKSLRAARSAAKFQQKREIDQPYTDRQGQLTGFVEGDDFPYAGSTNYADKPKASFGKPFV